MNYFKADVDAILALAIKPLTPGMLKKKLFYNQAAQRIAAQLKFIYNSKVFYNCTGIPRDKGLTKLCNETICKLLLASTRQELDSTYYAIAFEGFNSITGLPVTIKISDELMRPNANTLHVYTIAYILRFVELATTKAELIPFLTHEASDVRALAEREMRRF